MTSRVVPQHPTTRGLRRWAIAALPRPAFGFLAAIEIVACVVVVVTAWLAPLGWHQLGLGLVIVGLGLAAAEASRHVERRRRRGSDTPHVNFSSVWTFAAALLLPPLVVMVVVVVLYLHLWWRSWRGITGMSLYRVAFSTANVILSCTAAGWCARYLGLVPFTGEPSGAEVLRMAGVIAVYFAVNSTLVAVAIRLIYPDRPLTRLLGPRGDNVLELATLCVGALVAVFLTWRPWLVMLIFLPLVALHRGVLVRQLEQAITRDETTALLNTEHWRQVAARELARAQRCDAVIGLLRIDLDHFQHLCQGSTEAGEVVVRAVATTLRRVLRQGADLCARSGVGEFLVLVPGAAGTDLFAVGERLRTQIANTTVTVDGGMSGLRISASLGAASFPTHGTTLDELLLAADDALFAAKDRGRNQVRIVHGP